MSKYEKLKNDELKKLLTERGLSTTGKKADLIARLTESDTVAAAPSKAADSKSTTTANETEATQSSTQNNAAKQSDDTPKSTTAPAPASDTAVTPQSNDDREAKLAARAARFGLSKSEDEERKKARVQRFGTEVVHPEDKSLSQPKKKSEKTTDATTAAAATKGAEKKTDKSVDKKTEKRKVSVLDDPVEAEKARKRAIKFGLATPETAAAAATPAEVPTKSA